MKLAISNIAWAEERDKEIYQLMREYGYSGLEIAPTRIFSQNPYEKLEEAKKWSDELKKDYGFVIPSMQSIWFGRKERLFASQEERKVLSDYSKMAIDFAVTVGCKNLVFGCPYNRNCPEGANTNDAISFFKEIGDYAKSKGTVIGMEANPVIYNTNYINDTVSALALIEEVDSKGFLLNLDVGTIVQNKETLSELLGHVHYINHVHISEPGLKALEKRDLHRELKQILMKEEYMGFISVEMGKTDRISVIKDTLRYIQEVFGDEL